MTHLLIEHLEHLIGFIISKNPVSDEYFTYPYFSFITCLSCNSTMGKIVSHNKIMRHLFQNNMTLLLRELIVCKMFFLLLKRSMNERVAAVDVPLNFIRLLFLEVHQNNLLFVLLAIPPQQYTVKRQLRFLFVFI